MKLEYLSVPVLAMLLGVLFSCSYPYNNQRVRGAAVDSGSVDVLADVREINSDKYPAPPTRYRKGHVTPREFDAKAVKQTDTGFEIKLPSNAPVPTPLVYDGKVYVSGGFSTKEFYCFDATTGAVVWGLDLDDDGPSAAVCEDDVVIFNTESCTIFAVHAQTGEMLWSHWLGDPLTSTPTIIGGKVYTSYPSGFAGQSNQQNSQDFNLEEDEEEELAQSTNDGVGVVSGSAPTSHIMGCFDLHTGEILWQKWIDADVMSAPVADNGKIYATTFAGTVYEFIDASGEIVAATRARATSAPVIVGKNVYYTQRRDNSGETAKEAIVALDEDTRSTKFHANEKRAVYLDREVQGGATFSLEAEELDAGNGFSGGAPSSANAQAAQQTAGVNSVSGMQSFQGSRILNFRDNNFNSMGNEIVCTDPETGEVKWSTIVKGDQEREGGFMAAPPAAAGGQLFVATLEGKILQMDPESGKKTKEYAIGGPVRYQPAIEGGRIYVGTQDGRLICVDTGNRDFTGWPMWGGNAQHTGKK